MRFLKIFSTLTVAAVFLYLICFAQDDSIYNDVLRLHIIAQSDSAYDQAVKLEVRDLVQERYGAALSGYEDREAALAAAEKMLPEIRDTVNAFLADKTDYTADVSLADTWFPTKTYGEYALPCGTYTALCIRLGRAEGQNFWCVLYPPLCLGVSEADGEDLFLNCGLSKAEYELMRGEKPVYKVRFKLLEWLCGRKES